MAEDAFETREEDEKPLPPPADRIKEAVMILAAQAVRRLERLPNPEDKEDLVRQVDELTDQFLIRIDRIVNEIEMSR
ncbi:hypothetical protein ACFL2V_06755 [Pseudomonadota bacterium]